MKIFAYYFAIYDVSTEKYFEFCVFDEWYASAAYPKEI